MKDLTLSVACALVIALGIGLTFHWFYPRVSITTELCGLFVFTAILLNLTLSKLWSAMRKPGIATNAEAHK